MKNNGTSSLTTEEFVIESISRAVSIFLSERSIYPRILNVAAEHIGHELTGWNVIVDIEMPGKKLCQFSYPSNWWQAFKSRWFPVWLKRRFPVKDYVVDITAIIENLKLPGQYNIAVIPRIRELKVEGY